MSRPVQHREREHLACLGVDLLPEAPELLRQQIGTDLIGDLRDRFGLIRRLEPGKSSGAQRLVEAIECRVKILPRGHVSSDRRGLSGPPLQSGAL
jgi:hypothetical protein